MTVLSKDQTRRGRAAFTLIELLVVIAIIGILAALSLGVGKVVIQKRNLSRAQAEMARLINAIESYNKAYGLYPPDNPNSSGVNPLFYELTGTDYTNGTFNSKDGLQTNIISAEISGKFGIGGFQNSQPGKQFLPEVRSGEVASLSVFAPGVNNLRILVGPSALRPRTGSGVQDMDGNTVNPWRYNSSSPTNNTGKFDLWLEYQNGPDPTDVQIIKNW